VIAAQLFRSPGFDPQVMVGEACDEASFGGDCSGACCARASTTVNSIKDATTAATRRPRRTHTTAPGHRLVVSIRWWRQHDGCHVIRTPIHSAKLLKALSLAVAPTSGPSRWRLRHSGGSPAPPY